MKYVIYLHAIVTLMLTGLIWMIQVVHYPLFSLIGNAEFQFYEAEHISRITLLVFPLMAIEAITITLILLNRPFAIPLSSILFALILLTIIWIMTFFVNVPQHNQLTLSFDQKTHQILITTNWIRTISWSVKGILSIYFIDRISGNL